MTRAARRSALRSPLTLVRVLVDVALVVVVGFGLSGVVLGRIVPALGHPVYVVAGPSMEPTIHLGSAVLLDPVAPSALAVDDVVSLRSGPSRAVFTHRIIRVAQRDGTVWIETKGDANAEPDPAISPATDVIGRVTTVVPYAGYALTLLSAPAGVMFVLSVGITLMVLGWFLDGLGGDPRPSRARGAARPTRGVAPSVAARAAGAPMGMARTLGLATAAFAPPRGLALAVVGPAPGAASRAAVHLATLSGVPAAGARASATDRATAADPAASATDPAMPPAHDVVAAAVPPVVAAPAPGEVVPATPKPKAASRARRPRTASTAAASTSTPTRRRSRAAARATP